MISKIARYDYPSKWPELFSLLLNALSSVDHLQPSIQHSTLLLTLRYIVKELSSKRLPNDKKSFKEACISSHPCIITKWHQFHEICIKLLTTEQQQGTVDLPLITLCFQRLRHVLKIIRITSLSLDADVAQQLFGNVLNALVSFCDLATSMLDKGDDIRQLYHKALVEHTKVLLHPFEFQSTSIQTLVPSILDLCRQCVLTQSSNKLFPEKFIINSMNQIKYIFQDFHHITLPDEQLKELIRSVVLLDIFVSTPVKTQKSITVSSYVCNVWILVWYFILLAVYLGGSLPNVVGCVVHGWVALVMILND